MTRAEQLISAVQQSGFPYLDSLIHLFVGGSELHGAKVKNTDDLDIYGVYLEPPELVLGLDKKDFYVWSTAGNERQNGPDDIDVCLYSLRKWAGLAAKGNPTALHFLFSRDYAPSPEPWKKVLKHKDIFLSRQAATQFRGFAEAQLRRLQGIGTVLAVVPLPSAAERRRREVMLARVMLVAIDHIVSGEGLGLETARDLVREVEHTYPELAAERGEL